MLPRIRRLVGIAALTAVLASSCRSDTGQKVRAAPPGATPGGTLVVGILAPQTVAPWLVSRYDPYGSLIVETMCDPMVDLASRVRMQSPKSVVLKLRDDLRFPDGGVVDAEDIITSFSRAARSELASPVASLLEPVGGYEQLEQLPLASQDERARERLSGVTSPEPKSIEVVLSTDRPDYFGILGHPIASVVSATSFDDDPGALERQPACVGPYRMEAPWSPGTPVIRLVRSASYHGASPRYTRGGLGYADIIEFRVLPDAAALHQEFAAGRLDVGFLEPSELAAASRDRPASIVQAMTPTIDYMGLPTNRAPFDDPDVRVALSMAIDRRALASSVAGGARSAAGRFISPTVTKALPVPLSAKTSCRATMPSTGDLAGARQRLTKAGVELAGRPLRLSFNDEFGNRELVEAVAAQWREKLGVEADLVPVTRAAYLAAAETNSGFEDIFRMSWSPQYPDPFLYLGPLFASSELRQNNFSRFSSDDFDETLEGAVELVSPEDRVQAYVVAEDLLCRNMPMIPLLYGGRSYLADVPRVRSAAAELTDPTTGQLLLRELYITSPRPNR